MGLESFQQTQTPTSFTLRSQAYLPAGAAALLLIVMLLIGLPIAAIGLWLLLSFTTTLVHLVGNSLVVIGLLPALGTIYLLLDSLLTTEACFFDKTLGSLVLKERQGLFKLRRSQYALNEIVDVEVVEEIKLLWDDEACPVYHVVLRLQSGKQLPLTSLGSYYKEIPTEIATALRTFLGLPKQPAELVKQEQRISISTDSKGLPE